MLAEDFLILCPVLFSYCCCKWIMSRIVIKLFGNHCFVVLHCFWPIYRLSWFICSFSRPVSSVVYVL